MACFSAKSAQAIKFAPLPDHPVDTERDYNCRSCVFIAARCAWTLIRLIPRLKRSKDCDMWLTRPLILTIVIAPWLAAETAAGGDWPQILGPSRNGQAAGERLLDAWPSAGPQRLWKY